MLYRAFLFGVVTVIAALPAPTGLYLEVVAMTLGWRGSGNSIRSLVRDRSSETQTRASSQRLSIA